MFDQGYINSREVYKRFLGRSFCIGRAILVPWRENHKSIPSLSLFYNKDGEILHKDHSRGKSGNCIQFVQSLFNISYHEALNKIRSEIPEYNKVEFTSIRLGKNRERLFTEEFSLKIKYRKFSKREYQWWKDFGISQSTLEYFNVKTAEKVYFNDKLWIIGSHYNPCYVYSEYSDKTKTEEYKLYRPFNRNKWSGSMKSHIIQGINKINSPDTLFLIKSYKDNMSLFENFGKASVNKSSEGTYWSTEEIIMLKKECLKLVSMYDFDLTGIRLSNYLKKNFSIPFTFMSCNRHSRRLDYSDSIKYLGVQKTNEILKIQLDKIF